MSESKKMVELKDIKMEVVSREIKTKIKRIVEGIYCNDEDSIYHFYMRREKYVEDSFEKAKQKKDELLEQWRSELKTPDEYRSDHMVDFIEPIENSSTTIDVLQHIWGKKWGITALNYLYALRPSSVRVTRGEIKADARTWRVTVYVDDEDIIQKIEQEVAVGCVGYPSAYAMDLGITDRTKVPNAFLREGIYHMPNEGKTELLGHSMDEIITKYGGEWLV